MSALSDAARDYLRLRNRLGHELAEYHRVLPRFVALWTPPVCPPSPSRRRWPGRRSAASTRLNSVRAATDDHRPRLRPLPGRHRRAHRGAATRVDRRPTPLASAVHLQPRRHRRCCWPTPAGCASRCPRPTHETLIGLLAVTGMRVGEALRLDRGDIDWASGVLAIRESKFGKSRRFPCGTPRSAALDRYARIRDQFCTRQHHRASSLSTTGTRLLYPIVQLTFRRLCDQRGDRRRCRPPAADPRPTPQLRGAHPAGLVPRRSRCRSPAAEPVDLPGASRSPIDLLVPLGRPGAAGAGRATVWSSRGR